jgi:hypothetical protein
VYTSIDGCVHLHHRPSEHAVSRRTQITLTDRQHAFLRDEAGRTGLSLAELVRRAVDATYRPHDRPRFRGVELSVALWHRPDAALAARRLRPPPR